MQMSAKLVSAFAFAAMAMSAQTSAIAHLQKQGTATQMIVDGKACLMLAGELRNSTSSSLDFMKPVWPKLVALHLNTVLAAVQWELMEPKEGQFDFTLVDERRLRAGGCLYLRWPRSPHPRVDLHGQSRQAEHRTLRLSAEEVGRDRKSV